MKSAISLRRFFSSCPTRLSIFCSNTDDASIIPDVVAGKVSLNPGLATYIAATDYQKFINGTMSRTEWPVCVFFRTEEKPSTPDGLPEHICCWNNDIIEAEILAYSKDFGATFTEASPSKPATRSPRC